MMKGILLIGHGSRLPHNKNAVMLHANLLKEAGYGHIYVAFNEMCDPMIEDEMLRIVKDGVDELIALPLFLATGRHVEHDIPEKLGIGEGFGTFKSKGYGKEITIHYETPFGEDPMVVEAMAGKIDEIGYDDSTAVLVIAHGSPKSGNLNLAKSVVDRLRPRFSNIAYGFNEYNDPTIEDSFERFKDGGYSKIIIIPMFFASGMHLEEEIPEKLGIPGGCRKAKVSHKGKDICINYLEPCGMNPRMNGILIEKIKKHF